MDLEINLETTDLETVMMKHKMTKKVKQRRKWLRARSQELVAMVQKSLKITKMQCSKFLKLQVNKVVLKMLTMEKRKNQHSNLRKIINELLN